MSKGSGEPEVYREMTVEDWVTMYGQAEQRAERAESEYKRLQRGLRDIRETINAVLERR